MKTARLTTIVLCLFFVRVSTTLFGQGDMPGAGSTIQTVKSGSFVVPMDNNLQNIVPVGQAPFNLKAYGLINLFLQNGIPVKWVIKPNKQRDEIDFSASVIRYFPSTLPSAPLDFRAGPFIVPDTVLPCGLSTKQVIQKFGGNVAVYRLDHDVAVPVRYTMRHRPKIAVFNNGGNQLIHTKILDAAGITNYDVMDATDIGALINCYTFVSEPHADDTEVSTAVVTAVKSFVMNGGNFLAQCHAVTAYENKAFFVSTAGVYSVGATITNQYFNSPLAISQFNSDFQENEGGSVKNFTLNPGSVWLPNTYKVVTALQSDTVVAIGTHLLAPSEPGGNVFYLGGHDYSKGKVKGGADLSELGRVNALRLYLDAALIPGKKSNGAWANAGLDAQITCDSAVLGCNPTGPPGSTFRWIPAIGLSCSDCPNPIARPSVTTSYTVEVTNGCVARDTVQVKVPGYLPNKITVDTACSGDSTHFKIQNTAAYYNWNFGDNTSPNNTSDIGNPSHLFTSAGTHKIRFIFGASATCNDTLFKSVLVRAKPVVMVKPDTICHGKQALLVAKGASKYKWSNGFLKDSLRVTPLIYTSYPVTGTDAFGCTSVATGIVILASPITASFTKKDVSCFGGSDASIALAATGGKSPYTYKWAPVAFTGMATLTGLKQGIYKAIISDQRGCLDSVTVPLIQPPVLIVTISKTDVNCYHGSDGSVTISVSGGTSPYYYTWNPSGAGTSSLLKLTKGKYTVQVKDKNGCVLDTNAAIAELSDSIELKALATKPACFGQASGIGKASTNGKSGPFSFSWDAGSFQNDSVAILSKGIHQVTVKNKFGCMTSAEINVSEYSFDKVDLGNYDRCFENDPPLVLKATAKGKYYWSPNGESASSITVKTPGAFSLAITDSNGCIYNYAAVVRDVCPPRVFISNSFTPNGDGLNDSYTVYGEHFDNFHMFIFNRWGEIIFESTEKQHVWDGNYKGEQMPLGVYPWLITYTGNSKEYNGPYRMKGSVTVIR